MSRRDEIGDPDLKRFLRQIGQAIRAVRDRKHMTLEEVEAAGYPSWRHLQKVEAGHPFTMSTLFRIAKALRVKPSEFFKEH